MRHVLAAALAVLLLAGCASNAPSGDAESPTASEPAVSPASEASTIREVWEEIGCEENDPLGTRGIIEDGDAGKTPPMIKQGSCTPIEDGEMAFFWQFDSAVDAMTFLTSGELEVGSTDAVFISGAVVALAQDAATGQLLSESMEPFPA